MATAKHRTTTDAIILSPDEAYAVFDYQARALMNMSGEEFLRRWEAGEYDNVVDQPGHLHITRLAGFIPFARQKS
jgi:hypothetical protein